MLYPTRYRRGRSEDNWSVQRRRSLQTIEQHVAVGRMPNLSLRLGIVEEETDESAFWIEMLVDAEIVKAELVAELLDEADQLTAIWVSSIKTARGKKR